MNRVTARRAKRLVFFIKGIPLKKLILSVKRFIIRFWPLYYRIKQTNLYFTPHRIYCQTIKNIKFFYGKLILLWGCHGTVIKRKIWFVREALIMQRLGQEYSEVGKFPGQYICHRQVMFWRFQ